MKHLITLLFFLIGVAVFSSLEAVHPLAKPLAFKPEELIRKARRHLADEASLNQVDTIDFRGQIVEAKNNQIKRIHMQLKKPDEGRIVIEDDRAVNIYSISGLGGFSEYKNKITGDYAQKPLTPLEQEKLLASVLNELYFYEGPELVGSHPVVVGPFVLDDVNVYSLKEECSSKTYFEHIIDAKTGRCIETNIDGNQIQRQEGTIIAGGIRFPKLLKVFQGEVWFCTLDIKEIKINEPMDAFNFRIPYYASESTCKNVLDDYDFYLPK